MSKRSVREARTSSSSSHSLPSPKRNRARFSSDEMKANEENVSLKQILDKLACMEDRIEEHFGCLKSEISRLSAELKEEVENIKTNLKEVEKSLQSAWDSINDLEADAKTHSDFKKASQQTLDSHLQQINLLKTNSGNAAYQNQQKEIRALQASLAQEREKIIALENYSRRENLRFMNIPERRDENCVDVVYDIIKNELNIDPNARPIIARFLCREDRDNIYRVKIRLKKSRRFENAYITQDYAQPIQLERKVIIKAMFLAREKGAIAKVVDMQKTDHRI